MLLFGVVYGRSIEEDEARKRGYETGDESQAKDEIKRRSWRKAAEKDVSNEKNLTD